MEAQKLKEILEKHELWLENREGGERADLSKVDLSKANLSGADLRNADLSCAYLWDADLRNANLDFSCFPLWCGGKNWKVDKNLPLMLAAFICSMKCEDQDVLEMQTMLIDFAKKSHRADDILGELL